MDYFDEQQNEIFSQRQNLFKMFYELCLKRQNDYKCCNKHMIEGMNDILLNFDTVYHINAGTSIYIPTTTPLNIYEIKFKTIVEFKGVGNSTTEINTSSSAEFAKIKYDRAVARWYDIIVGANDQDISTADKLSKIQVVAKDNFQIKQLKIFFE